MRIQEKYEEAVNIYKKYGVDVEAVLNKLSEIPISMHCWQGDDIKGFYNQATDLSGGIAVTGNFPGAARDPQELRDDIEFVLKMIPGKMKVNLHAIYLDTDETLELNEIQPRHFNTWVQWAKKNNVGLDFNPTLFSHPKSSDGMTLSHPNPEIRNFWIEHVKQSRKIAAYFGEELGQVSVNNVWIPDGMKDNPVDRLSSRKRLLDALDEIYEEDINEEYLLDAVESKLFGIGAESYTVGSHEFYYGYGLTRDKLVCFDTGHFHPTESVSDKLSAYSLFGKKILLHISRPVRWDSDHVVIMNDDLMAVTHELVRSSLLERTFIGLDFFDATINRVAAWIIGIRNVRKALLKALLEPTEKLQKIEENQDFTARLVLTEQLKDLPYNDVWNYYCFREGVEQDLDWYDFVKVYESEILKERNDA